MMMTEYGSDLVYQNIIRNHYDLLGAVVFAFILGLWAFLSLVLGHLSSMGYGFHLVE